MKYLTCMERWERRFRLCCVLLWTTYSTLLILIGFILKWWFRPVTPQSVKADLNEHKDGTVYPLSWTFSLKLALELQAACSSVLVFIQTLPQQVSGVPAGLPFCRAWSCHRCLSLCFTSTHRLVNRTECRVVINVWKRVAHAVFTVETTRFLCSCGLKRPIISV